MVYWLVRLKIHWFTPPVFGSPSFVLGSPSFVLGPRSFALGSPSFPPVLFHLSPHLSVPRRHVQGWSEAGWHRNYTIGGVAVPSTREVVTPNLDALVREGIELDRMYAYKCCR